MENFGFARKVTFCIIELASVLLLFVFFFSFCWSSQGDGEKEKFTLLPSHFNTLNVARDSREMNVS